jgi:hypothetical protein
MGRSSLRARDARPGEVLLVNRASPANIPRGTDAQSGFRLARRDDRKGWLAFDVSVTGRSLLDYVRVSAQDIGAGTLVVRKLHDR